MQERRHFVLERERDELNARIVVLAAFISRADSLFRAMDDEDKDLLRRQRDAMLEYSEVLEQRIRRFAEK